MSLILFPLEGVIGFSNNTSEPRHVIYFLDRADALSMNKILIIRWHYLVNFKNYFKFRVQIFSLWSPLTAKFRIYSLFNHDILDHHGRNNRNRYSYVTYIERK